ncbi:hypothetical protein HY224_00505 [Candidatus Uhrbacteria bacterium]|nr:hypothetical protein [Candidatus Uhrbacteria bacterium]
MVVIRHIDIEKDIKDLKHSAAPRESLDAWQRLFCLKGIKETPAIDPFPGFGGSKIYKARAVPLKENVGKSKGYRIIFQEIQSGYCRILVFSRHGVYKTEQELIDLIWSRLNS